MLFTAIRAPLSLSCGRGLGYIVLALAGLYGTWINAQDGTESAENTLQSVEFSTLPGNRLQIALQHASPPSAPQTFTIDNPARVAIDLAGTRNALAQRVVPIGVGIARSISTAEAQGKTRVVLNLANLVPYETEVEGNAIYITLDTAAQSSTADSAVAPASGISGQASATLGPTSSSKSLVDIDFRRGEQGEGRVIVTLSEPGIPLDVNDEGNRVVIDFLGASAPDKLVQRLDVLDFATPVRHVDTFIEGGNARVVITSINRDFEQLTYQSDNVVTIELKPIPEEIVEERARERFGYTGERLSLNFQDIEVRSVLQLLADFTDLNIVVSDTVDGKLTLRLKNVPWDQALDIILKTKALGMRQNGNVILIAPTEEIAAREKLELEAQQQVEELAPLNTALIQVNYAKATEIATVLETEGSSILSERGSVTTDERTNTLLITDTADKLDNARTLVSRLDRPVRQVLIESRIVVATDDFNKEIGINWGVTRDTTNDGEGFILTGTDGAVSEIIDNEELTSPGQYNVNLPTSTNPFGRVTLALAKLPFGTLLELELQALQAEGRGEVISSPRVITANQKEALIETGVEIPYQEASSSGATSVSFKKAVLSLRVTPQITPDDRIIMDLRVNKDSVGELFLGVPSIDTNEVETQVLVDNGDTVVLGGIYEHDYDEEIDRVPFFSDLPLIGNLFRSTRIEDDKSELLVFVTPKIVRENAGIDY